MLTPLLNKYKTYLYTALVCILATVAIYTYVLNKVKAHDAVQIADLNSQISTLKKQSIEQAAINTELTAKVASQTTDVTNAHKVTANAVTHAAQLPNQIIVAPIVEVEQAKAVIAKNYGDTTVTYDGVNFNILKQTTFNLLDDAVEWKINGPILINKLDGTQKALDASQNENVAKDSLIADQTNLVTGITKSLDLSNQQSLDKDKQINLYERDLKIEGMNGKIKLGFGIVIGGGSYYIYDHFIKRK